MIIGIDGRIVQKEKAGMGYYLTHLLSNLARLDQENQYKVLGDPLAFKAPNFKNYRLMGRKRKMINFLWKYVNFPKFERRVKGCDLGFFPNFIIPPTNLKKTVLMIPDLSYLYFPAFIEQKNLNFLNKFVPQSIKKASAIITISENTKADLIKHFNLPPDKIFITPLAAEEIFVPQKEKAEAIKEKYGLSRDYILFVGTIEPRKNIETLIKAFASLQLIRKKYMLVIAGSRGWYCDGIIKLIRKLYLDDDVKILGYVPQSDLPSLYSNAALFVFPSVYEGFGLPVVEAMACEVPVICSNASSLPEVGGEAVEYFSRFDTEVLAEKISSVLLDEAKQKKMIEAGRLQSQKFYWSKTAQETLEVFKEVYSE